jgi:hypothetical protein
MSPIAHIFRAPDTSLTLSLGVTSTVPLMSWKTQGSAGVGVGEVIYDKEFGLYCQMWPSLLFYLVYDDHGQVWRRRREPQGKDWGTCGEYIAKMRVNCHRETVVSWLLCCRKLGKWVNRNANSNVNTTHVKLNQRNVEKDEKAVCIRSLRIDSTYGREAMRGNYDKAQERLQAQGRKQDGEKCGCRNTCG